MLKKVILYIGVLLVGFQSQAQDIRLVMSAPNAVAAGDQFRLTFNINERGENLTLPDLGNFDVLMGPSFSSSTSFQIINGKTTQSRDFSYTYILRAREAGTFTIRPGSIEVDGKVYQSNSLTIQVVTGQSQAAPAQQQGQQQGQQQERGSETTPSGSISRNDLFIRLELSRHQAYKGQQIIATVKLYANPNMPLAGFEEVNLPTYEGFYTQDIDIPQQINFKREVFNDRIYQVGVLKKTVLFPQQTGSITIKPFSITTLVQQRVRQRSFFDDFFTGIQTVRAKLTSDAVSVSVRDLPPAPACFSGGVGDFRISSEISQQEVTTNDAVTLKLTISGTGNIRLIQAPKLALPGDFEQYDPSSADNVRASDGGVSGSKSIEYLFQPRYAGDFKIPSVQFAWFNPASGKYEQQSTPEYDLKVTKGEGDQGTGVVRSLRKQDIQTIGQDIRFISQKQVPLKEKGSSFFGSTLFWAIYLLGTAAFAVFFVVYRKKMEENSNIALVRNKKANRVARKHLKVASDHLKKQQGEAFYDALLKAFWGYLSDKLSIPLADLRRETAVEGLEVRKVDPGLISDFLAVVDQCEYARFAPSGGAQVMHELYEKAEDVISKMEKQIKR
ncbi:MAG: hypothetical protein BWX87_01001 [Bacteroidetes bacterium ADurb.Bin123]|nr:MAG: hypothetical protein BWX87_01001 [Bacteroidetes bacterium ADurb.Bin123]